MIKFFRNIRKALINEGKTTKYLKYAIGEIVLVVIGILIALQINNWNEERKDRKIEKEMLLSFASDLEGDCLHVTNLIHDYENDLIYQDSILKVLFESKTTSPEKFLIWNYQIFVLQNYFEPTTGTYDESESSGRLQLITNKTIKERLNSYYTYVKSDNTANRTNKEMTFDRSHPYFFSLFGASKELYKTRQRDYDLPSIDIKTFKQDNQYISKLTERRVNHFIQLKEYEKLLEWEIELLDLISNETTN
ncbi:DUF6090 family protein [Mangrovimonas sp. TPBH4]|uniref:DUF6090 family protein n=1 Tax=Mangrovimonas sp. TPBH4 TaxID=1645914 RepID=UPI0006B61346|nr:DUF6090 family protein [Mangrovimonas sp. TPBH4]